MSPKHRQLHAPWPKASGNVFQALVNCPADGFDFTNGHDHSYNILLSNEKRLYTIEERVMALQTGQAPTFEAVFSKLDTLLEKIDAVSNENTALHAAYNSSREETVALKAAVDTLTKKLDDNIAISAPPSPDTTASSTSIEEMTMQLSNVHNDIQDILEAVRNPPSKRKQHTSNQDTELMMLTPKNR
jgi:regulator of replication initiation timing